jgi:hypothetical protein
MDTPLQYCTIEERGIVVSLAEGVKPVEIHRRTLAQCGQSTISQRKVYEWVEGRRCAVADSLPISDGSGAHLASRAAENPLLRRNTETS